MFPVQDQDIAINDEMIQRSNKRISGKSEWNWPVRKTLSNIPLIYGIQWVMEAVCFGVFSRIFIKHALYQIVVSSRKT